MKVELSNFITGMFFGGIVMTIIMACISVNEKDDRAN